jgi:hypothetical protein
MEGESWLPKVLFLENHQIMNMFTELVFGVAISQVRILD